MKRFAKENSYSSATSKFSVYIKIHSNDIQLGTGSHQSIISVSVLLHSQFCPFVYKLSESQIFNFICNICVQLLTEQALR